MASVYQSNQNHLQCVRPFKSAPKFSKFPRSMHCSRICIGAHRCLRLVSLRLHWYLARGCLDRRAIHNTQYSLHMARRCYFPPYYKPYLSTHFACKLGCTATHIFIVCRCFAAFRSLMLCFGFAFHWTAAAFAKCTLQSMRRKDTHAHTHTYMLMIPLFRVRISLSLCEHSKNALWLNPAA